MAVAPDTQRATSLDKARAGRLVLAISPVLATVIGLATGYLDPMLANPPGVLGLPLGVVLLFLAAALTALAVVAATRARPPATGWAPTAAFALPALALVALGPVVIRGLS